MSVHCIAVYFVKCPVVDTAEFIAQFRVYFRSCDQLSPYHCNRNLTRLKQSIRHRAKYIDYTVSAYV